jgi:hypothetical protein
MPEGYKVRLKKLDPKTEYLVKSPDDSKEPIRMSGTALMEDGLPVELPRKPQSALFILEKKGS